MGGEDLRDGTAAIVANHVDLFDLQLVQNLGDHMRLGRERDILGWPDLGIPQTHQVDGNTTAPMLHAFDDMAPVIAVEGNAMHKKSWRALASLDKRNSPGLDRDIATARMKACNIHDASVAAEVKVRRTVDAARSACNRRNPGSAP